MLGFGSVLVICLLLVKGSSAGEAPSTHKRSDPRRIGIGEYTKIECAPFIVSIQRDGYHFCSGSLIAPNYVVTAGVCVFGQNTKNLMIRAGSSCTKNGGQLVPVKDYLINHNFNPITKRGDIAVILLKHAVVINGVTTRTIGRPQRLQLPTSCGGGYIYGWEQMRTAGFLPNTRLKRAPVLIGRQLPCGTAYRHNECSIHAGNLCAVTHNFNSCVGDIGSPVVRKNLIVAVVSWCRGCAQIPLPCVLSSMSYFDAFITNATRILNDELNRVCPKP
ncbi:trypsin beta [Stomoxys calcitrans]|uniref:trypsin beta n=1 Tax=Stomoxys calcitrans TaxID=35570 RepID=UPI0027E2A6C2|nr:trypsin beta [Stomoxys calcitrans]